MVAINGAALVDWHDWPIERPSARAALRTYGGVFGVSTDEERAAVLRKCMTETAEVVFPSGYRAVGPDEVAYLIGSESRGEVPSRLIRDDTRTVAFSVFRKPAAEHIELRHDFGDWLFEMWGFQESHGYFRYSFAMTYTNGDVVAGTDFGELCEDGRICRLVVFPDA